MRKIIYMIIATVLAINTFADVNLGAFRVDDRNTLYAGKTPIELCLYDQNWTSSNESKGFMADEGFPKIQKNKYFESKGVFTLLNGFQARYEKSIKVEKDGYLDVSYKISGLKDAKFNELAVYISFPLLQFMDGMSIDGKKIELPKKYEGGMFSVSNKNANVCEFIGEQATITVKGNPLSAYIQDNRRFKSDNATLRIRLQKNQDDDYVANFKIAYKPATQSVVKLPYNSDLMAGNLPKGRKSFGDISYEISKDSKCAEIAPDSQISIKPTKSAETNLYLLNAFEAKESLSGNLAKVLVEYEDGSVKEVDVPATDTNSFANKTMYSVWRTRPEAVGLRKLYSTKINLPKGKIKNITLKNISAYPWKIASATLSSANLRKESMVCYYVSEDEIYAPYVPSTEIKAGSALDFSFLLDAPAGKYGFAKAKGDKIVFEKNPEKELKLFGNNLCFKANYPTHENATRLADVFARTGYNTVRLHHFDGGLVDMKSDDGVELLPDQLDKLDFLCAEMKKKGVYITLDVYISRVLKKAILEDEFVYDEKKARNSDVKPLFFLSENAMKNWEKYASNLFNHVNPYTGLAWKNDPAIVSVSLVNEDNLSGLYYGKQRAVFDKKFEVWLNQNKIEKTAENEKWLRDKFLNEIYTAGRDRMINYLRSIGVNYMLTDLNHRGGLSLSIISEKFDIIDTHYYYGHPHFIEKPWSLPARVLSTSALGSNSGGGADKGVQIIANKPFYMTEWSHVASNKMAAEGGFIMGAYIAMQGWNGLYRFAYSHSDIDFNQKSSGFFDSVSNPILALSDRAVSAFFLRGDVARSDVVIPYLLARDIHERPNNDNWRIVADNSKLMGMLSLLARPETTMFDKINNYQLPQNAKFAVATEDGWIKAMDGKKVFKGWTIDDLEVAAKELGCDISNGVYSSTTGEITQDKKNETLLVETKNSEAYIGDEGAKIKGKFGRLSCTTSRSAVLVTSITEKSLNTSKRILILQLSDIKNTNMKYADDSQKILLENGGLPLLLASAKATLTLNRDFTGFKLYALNDAGERLEEIPMKIKDGKTIIRLRTLRDFGAVMAYELFIVPKESPIAESNSAL